MKKIHKNLSESISVRSLLNADYESTHADMFSITLDRIEKKKQGIITTDELWIVEHKDVYTLGQAGKKEHILQETDTPIIQTDRGGQVTWHGRGQLVVYWLFDLKNLDWSVRDLVSHAEQSIEDVLNEALLEHRQSNPSQSHHYIAKARNDAPGVYIYNDEGLLLGKIASLGFKIKQGFSYHGIALNLNCDLSAFNAINPCGYAGMQMLRLADFVKLAPFQSDNNDASQGNVANNPYNNPSIHELINVSTNSEDGLDNDAMDKKELNVEKRNVENLNIEKLKITMKLINNIIERHQGNIKLRSAEDTVRNTLHNGEL